MQVGDVEHTGYNIQNVKMHTSGNIIKHIVSFCF